MQWGGDIKMKLGKRVILLNLNSYPEIALKCE